MGRSAAVGIYDPDPKKRLVGFLTDCRITTTARKLSDTDPLTGVHNRRFLDKILESEWSRARRYSLQLSVLPSRSTSSYFP